jgi:hypothetical protein
MNIRTKFRSPLGDLGVQILKMNYIFLDAELRGFRGPNSE